MLIKCPYCDIEVEMEEIESEDGCCPECGAIVTVTSLFGDEQGEDGGPDVEEGEFKEGEGDEDLLHFDDLEEDADDEREENY